MPYCEFKTKGGIILKFLIDTGSNKNYIRSRCVRHPLDNKKIFYAKSIGGNVRVTHHYFFYFFKQTNHNLKFFILPNLNTFDGIIGNDSLKEMKAVIYTNKNYMILQNKFMIPLKQKESEIVNTIENRLSHLNYQQKTALDNIVHKCPKLFSEPDEKLTYTTSIIGEIRTITNEPVYSKSYSYPMCLKEEIDNQIKELLQNGIIRPSRSPYNSPVWIVPKKLDASGEKKFRMVIDYRKLNEITIADKYPIPEINEVLYNLGKNRYFTVLDLKSGFHQIKLKNSDIEKTAFSISNGKYEFLRLPFGTKNGPAIFQRAVDDILREFIGKICYVYIDDIIVFGRNEQEHLNNLKIVFETLQSANMKIQLDKCEFLKNEVEFLGFIISADGIKTNKKKVQAIVDFPLPKTLKEVRSFIGMSGYYRRFVMDYAQLAKPLTSLLRGEDGRVSKYASKNREVSLNEKAIEAFNKIKSTLISQDVILNYPDLDQEFELTTDASNYALGAVLSQKDRPIMFISRTLTKTEEHYATNEKEMLAIIWALNTLRNFLYGSRKVKIITDHQPLTYALSSKNNNSKMKRWKAILEEYNYELHYKPGKNNVVADTLSRIPMAVNSMTMTQHSDDSSSHNLIPTVECPVNVFRNQLIIRVGNAEAYQLENPFKYYERHTITKQNFNEIEIIDTFRKYLKPDIINGLNVSENIMGKIQDIFPLHFSTYKIRFTQLLVRDIEKESEQDQIIISIHNRAHRGAVENRLQILEKFYFPKISKKLRTYIKMCHVCNENKYDRHPNKIIISKTPIPKYPGHTLHIDIYSTEKNLVLTAIDKLTKLAQGKIIKSRAVEDIRRPLRDLLFFFNVPEAVVMDNEPALN